MVKILYIIIMKSSDSGGLFPPGPRILLPPPDKNPTYATGLWSRQCVRSAVCLCSVREVILDDV